MSPLIIKILGRPPGRQPKLLIRSSESKECCELGAKLLFQLAGLNCIVLEERKLIEGGQEVRSADFC